MFYNGVRTTAPLPRIGEFVQLRIRWDDIDLGPPSVNISASGHGAGFKTPLHTGMILSIDEDDGNASWNADILLCRAFTYSPSPLEHITNMDPDVGRLLLPLPSANSSDLSTAAAFGLPVHTEAYVSEEAIFAVSDKGYMTDELAIEWLLTSMHGPGIVLPVSPDYFSWTVIGHITLFPSSVTLFKTISF